ncbi:hypothetical protein CH63R_04321 [Colletotrichum higginsianum IMI 349063]|uniref:Uncharacterized protein n=1 Tax=Colletotrichum higginsianum (strain IMI 349063) TaxID=759273 RepID=A0A1B7YJ51_COLHI|nr:hypothetical protein CH63R_04321 [Colletotrichum higginsianum IMI 349063]OBR12025.1 hypothetical protein CH63R_04321 [Colletotrichum higginsianum IMI 349063]
MENPFWRPVSASLRYASKIAGEERPPVFITRGQEWLRLDRNCLVMPASNRWDARGHRKDLGQWSCMPWSCFREAASSRTPALDLDLLRGISTVAPHRRRCRRASRFNRPTGRLAPARVLLLLFLFFFVFVSPTTETTMACKGRIHIVPRGLPGFRGATISARMTSSRLRCPTSSHTQYTYNGRQFSLDLTTLADAESKWRDGPARLRWIGKGMESEGHPPGRLLFSGTGPANIACLSAAVWIALPYGNPQCGIISRPHGDAIVNQISTVRRHPSSAHVRSRAWHGEAMSALGFVAQKNKVPTGSRPACRFVQPSNRVAVQCSIAHLGLHDFTPPALLVTTKNQPARFYIYT